MGKVLLAQDKLLPARSEFEQVLAALPALGADPQAALGNIALRENDITAAVDAYDKAVRLLPTYQKIVPLDYCG